MAVDHIILAIIIGTLAAIVYSLRILVLMERRIARMDYHIEKLTVKVLKEELKLEKKEEPFMSLIVYDKDLERMAFAKENEWVNVKEFQIMKYSIYNSKKTQDYFNEINREAMENCEKNLEELKK